ncbi:dihydroxyacetone kinase subunit DhaL [Microcella sp.]|uniref:dihydroxyacetone kinase subunit DhaL n=1 Tax=Microcella sp. TaxID=1913979 RepID=UPI002565C79B|nr:dihydroxyacetone kinase subunit DhaL [Microcella sp.]MBX9471791.1 dihydroxyacetone kinase subunit L [Microcella sp.]
MTLTVCATNDWLRRFAQSVDDNAQLLTDLDAAIGDADHGSNMRRGMLAVVEQLENEPASQIDGALRAAGMTLISTVGGASGVLYGTFLLRMATALADRATATGPEVIAALHAGLEGVRTRGHAELGDKTMVDVLAPVIDALDAAVESGASLADAASTAAIAAQAARDATTGLVARKGRASYLGERSAGHVDPGAASTALLFAALAGALAETAAVEA